MHFSITSEILRAHKLQFVSRKERSVSCWGMRAKGKQTEKNWQRKGSRKRARVVPEEDSPRIMVITNDACNNRFVQQTRNDNRVIAVTVSLSLEVFARSRRDGSPVSRARGLFLNALHQQEWSILIFFSVHKKDLTNFPNANRGAISLSDFSRIFDKNTHYEGNGSGLALRGHCWNSRNVRS